MSDYIVESLRSLERVTMHTPVGEMLTAARRHIEAGTHDAALAVELQACALAWDQVEHQHSGAAVMRLASEALLEK